MKFDIPLRFQARAWLSLPRPAPPPQLVMRAYEELGFAGAIPASAPEIAPLTGAMTTRPVLIVPARNLTVSLMTESVDVTVQFATPVANPADAFEAFAKEASVILAKIASVFERRAARLALVQEGILTMPAARVQSTGAHFIRLPSDSGSLVEWDWRAATRVEREFGARHESTNTVVLARGVSGHLAGPLGTQAIDGIYLQFDINTLAENIGERISTSEIGDFMSLGVDWHSSLMRSTQLFMDGPRE